VAETTPNGLENLKAFVLKIYLRLAGTPLSSKDEVLRTSFWSVDTSSLSSMAVKENEEESIPRNRVSGESESESENCWWVWDMSAGIYRPRSRRRHSEQANNCREVSQHKKAACFFFFLFSFFFFEK
jgi:hypothetical protein